MIVYYDHACLLFLWLSHREPYFSPNRKYPNSVLFFENMNIFKSKKNCLEQDTPDGSGDGKYKGERVFQCGQYHAVFTTADFIMKEQLYNEGSVDTYVVLTHEDENAQHHSKTEISIYFFL